MVLAPKLRIGCEWCWWLLDMAGSAGQRPIAVGSRALRPLMVVMLDREFRVLAGTPCLPGSRWTASDKKDFAGSKPSLQK